MVTSGAVLTKTTSFVRIGFFNSIHNPQSKGDSKQNLYVRRKYFTSQRFDGKPVGDMRKKYTFMLMHCESEGIFLFDFQ